MFIRKIFNSILNHGESFDYPYKIFGVFCLVTYPAYYFIWREVNPIGYENFWLRLFAFIAAIPLAFSLLLPEKFKRYLPIYYYSLILYCLPFFFFYLLLKNDFSHAAVLNSATVIVLCVLLLDLIPLLIILIIGCALAFFLFHFQNPYYIFPKRNYVDIVISYGTIIFFGSLFAHRKELIQKARLSDKMLLLSAAVAHELRTPLSGIQMGAEAINEYLPTLLETYKIASHEHPELNKINDKQLKLLNRAADNIKNQTTSAFSFINMLLTNIKQIEVSDTKLETCSIAQCVNEAIQRFPFSPGQHENIHLNTNSNFNFIGNKELFQHVIFNLLKNSFYYIQKAGKGAIFISLKKTGKENMLIFKDTGYGIADEDVSRIFNRFFSKTPHGAGIGLAFCKQVMQSFGGQIKCQSKIGEFTEFTLYFPLVKESK